MTGTDRRANDQTFKDKMIAFMSRIDQRNIDKDLTYAVQGELATDHEKRISTLEHKATALQTIIVGGASIGLWPWITSKIAKYF